MEGAYSFPRASRPYLVGGFDVDLDLFPGQRLHGNRNGERGGATLNVATPPPARHGTRPPRHPIITPATPHLHFDQHRASVPGAPEAEVRASHAHPAAHHFLLDARRGARWELESQARTHGIGRR